MARPDAHSHLRIARPTTDLRRAEAFWADGLGLDVLTRVVDGHQLVMLGWPDAAWHLELVEDAAITPRPTEEDLLVLYLGEHADDEFVARLCAHGGRVVAARNPYWDRWGVTIEDPDGYRLVLSRRRW
ncbi:VOC family protein [Nocardioides sp. SYSU DS0663]|uniref:VOC family protein n=1 Tax=Nocardioides sp. SYSU DS0663 TaxID=3416445 RepID=UPI003F4BB043